MNPKVTEFLSQTQHWKAELQALRKMVLKTELTEDFKWRNPCYTINNKNVLMLAGFKNHCAISFFKGAMMRDAQQLLTFPGENSQSVKMMKFQSLEKITQSEKTILKYIQEAIQIEESGEKLLSTQSEELVFPEELIAIFEKNSAFKKAFFNLTKGRQRGYNLYFTSAKQTETRTTRIEKYIPRILKGFGIHDCDCGHSQKMPKCDGSHKQFQPK